MDTSAQALWGGELAWGGLAIVFPVSKTRPGFFGVRLGYEAEYTGGYGANFRGSRLAHAVDGSYVLRLVSAGGHAFQGELGAEALFRGTTVTCCDNAPLATTSFGARIALLGELALGGRWALFGQAGLRTADHILEVKVFPTLSGGVRARF